MTLDFSRCRLSPFAHQREDVAWLLERPYAFIASEMRTGKSKIIVDAAQFLFEAGDIDKVIVVAPAPVRDVWYDEALGEIAKHAWLDVPNQVVEYHGRPALWINRTADHYLTWYITNYEFIGRSKMRLKQMLPACGPRTLLVLDESSFVKNAGTQQAQACLTLRRRCGRVVLLNGTPIYHSPLDLFSQGNLLHPSILDCRFVTLFKARYAVQTPVLGYGGKPLKKTITKGKWSKEIIIQEISGWTNLDDLQRRFAPYTVRRLQAECLDLPPKLDPVTLTATLEPETWRVYKEMRDELVVWLQSNQVVTSATAAIKALRLSQITGGFLSGIEDANVGDDDEFDGVTDLRGIEGNSSRTAADSGDSSRQTKIGDDDDPNGSGSDVGTVGDGDNGQDHGANQTVFDAPTTPGSTTPRGAGSQGDRSGPAVTVQEVGREKLDILLWFIEQRLDADPNLHLVTWSRFRAEVFRTEVEVKKKFPQFETALILGGQKKSDRLHALSLLKPETSPVGPVFVAGIEGTGSFGLDMTAAHTCVTLSSGYSPGRSAQTLDRVYGPGQKFPVAFFNIIAVGPKGQKTIDHDILVARLTGENIARRTAAAWVKALTEE